MYIIIYSLCCWNIYSQYPKFIIKYKKFFLKFLVNRQVWPCFEDLVIKEIIVKSKLNLDAWFYTYCSFNFEFVCMWVTWSSLSSSSCKESFLFKWKHNAKQPIINRLDYDPKSHHRYDHFRANFADLPHSVRTCQPRIHYIVH